MADIIIKVSQRELEQLQRVQYLLKNGVICINYDDYKFIQQLDLELEDN